MNDAKNTAPPRMSDIARRAGVSRMAVSAVLMGTGNGRIRVSEETAARIRQIAEEIGYRPNPAARQLAGQRSGMVGIVAYDWGNFLTQWVLSRLHAAAADRDLRVVASFARHSTEPVHRLFRDLKSGWLDGLVYLAFENEPQWAEVAELFEGEQKVVVALGDLQAPGVPSVISDVRPGSRECIEHLASRGRRRPVFLTEELETIAARARLETYRQACRDHRIEFDESQVIVETRGWRIADRAYYSRFDSLARELAIQKRADAILCDTDFTAVGLIKAFRRIGIRVPDDVSVIGWGDLQFAPIFDPPLTTVAYEMTQLLTRVMDRLIATDDSAAEAGIERIPMALKARESS